MRQILLGQFTTGVVEQRLKTRALLLQAPLQGTLRQVQRLRHGIALGFALGQQTAQHLPRLVGYATLGKPRQVFAGKAVMQQRHGLVGRRQRRFHVRALENQRIVRCVEHQRRMEGLFIGFEIGRLIALDQHLARVQRATGQPAAQRQGAGQ